MDGYDMVLLLSGWIAAFVITCGWGYSEYKKKTIKDPKEFASFVIKWLDSVASNEHIRKRIDAFWNTDIKPSFEKFVKKIFGNTLDWEGIFKKINDWGDAPWDDE